MRPASLTGRQPSALRSAPDAAASYITRITSIQSRYRTVEASRRNSGSLTFFPFKSWISAGSAATPRRQLWRNGEGECGCACVVSGLAMQLNCWRSNLESCNTEEHRRCSICHIAHCDSTAKFLLHIWFLATRYRCFEVLCDQFFPWKAPIQDSLTVFVTTEGPISLPCSEGQELPDMLSSEKRQNVTAATNPKR